MTSELKVVELKNDWFGRVEPKEVLSGAAADENIEDVLVISYTKDGGLQAHSSIAEIGEIILMVERFKHALLNNQFESA